MADQVVIEHFSTPGDLADYPHWTELRAGGEHVVTNGEVAGTGSPTPLAYFDRALSSDDQTAAIEVGAMENNNTVGVLLRYDPGTTTGYVVAARRGTSANYRAWSWNGTTLTPLGDKTDAGESVVDGDVMTFQIVGTELRAYHNGTRVTAATWTGLTHTTGKYCGAYNGVGSSGTTRVRSFACAGGSLAPSAGPVSVTANKPGNIGVVMDVPDHADGEQVRVVATIDGVEISNQLITIDDNFENQLSGSFIGAGAVVAISDANVGREVVITATPQSTFRIYRMVASPPMDWFGDAVRSDTSFHSGPSGTQFRGKYTALARNVVGDIVSTYDGRPAGVVLDAIAGERTYDRYHASEVRIAAAGGLFDATATHNDNDVSWQWRTNPHSPAIATASNLLGSGEDGTYFICDTESSSATRVSAISRVDGQRLHLFAITDPETVSPTETTDVLCDVTSPVFCYPRSVFQRRDSNNALVEVVVCQLRNNTSRQWRNTFVAIKDVATGQCRTLDGTNVGGTTDGTTGSPRFTEAQVSSAGALDIIPTNGSDQRYTGTDPDVFAIAGGDFAFAQVFADGVGLNDSTTTSTQIRLAYHDGTSLITTTANSDPFGLDGGPSFRLTGVCNFVDEDTLDVYVGCFEFGELPSANTDIFSAEYNWFGAKNRIRQFSVDLTSVSDGDDLAAAVTHVADHTFDTPHAGRIRRVNGGGYLIDYPNAMASETLQMADHQYINGITISSNVSIKPHINPIAS